MGPEDILMLREGPTVADASSVFRGGGASHCLLVFDTPRDTGFYGGFDAIVVADACRNSLQN